MTRLPGLALAFFGLSGLAVGLPWLMMPVALAMFVLVAALLNEPTRARAARLAMLRNGGAGVPRRRLWLFATLGAWIFAFSCAGFSVSGPPNDCATDAQAELTTPPAMNVDGKAPEDTNP